MSKLRLKTPSGGSVAFTASEDSPLDTVVLVPAGNATMMTDVSLVESLATNTQEMNEALASSSGSAGVGYMPAGVGTVSSLVQTKLRERVSVKDFGALGNGSTNDTVAIQSAIDFAAVTGKFVYVPAGTYLLTPSTVINDEDTSYLTYAALLMRSNMHVFAEPGATFKIANNVSTDAAPKSMGMFCTDTPISKVSIVNLTMDMNGANNLISPLRPTTYRRYNQSQILVSGKPASTVAYMDDVHIEHCVFTNNPGVCCIIMAQSNAIGAAIGRRWRILFNKFVNNGLDTDDHTSVFAWADDVEFSGNEIFNATSYATVGRTGGNTGYEIHGNNHKVTNNRFRNYFRGIWVSSNLTAAEVQDCVISNNEFYTLYYGVDFFRTVAALGTSSNTVITGNTFRLDGTTISAPAPTQKAAVQIASEYTQGSVLITGNTGVSEDDVVGSAFLVVAAQGVAGQMHTNIVCDGNSIRGFQLLASINASAAARLGVVTVSNNSFMNPVKPAAEVGIGVFVRPLSPIETLTVTNNNFLGVNGAMSYGLYLDAGTILKLKYSPGMLENLLVSSYFENSVTIGERTVELNNIPFTPIFSAGTNITLGDGTVTGFYSVAGKLVTAVAKLVVGATTVLPGGTLGFTLPITSGGSGINFIGNWRIFDTSATQFIFGTVNVDGTSPTATCQISGGLFATNTVPVALAVGDVLTMQITYLIP